MLRPTSCLFALAVLSPAIGAAAEPPLLPEFEREVAATRVSPDGRYTAYAMDGVRDNRTWGVYDRRSGYMVEWRVDDAAKASTLVWRRDGGALLYVRRGERDALVERGLKSSNGVRINTHGSPPRRLELVAPPGTSAVFLVGGDDERRRSSVWLVADGRDWSVEPVAVLDGAHIEPVHADPERVILVTDHQAPRGKVVIAKRWPGGLDEWKVLVPEPEAGSRIEQVTWKDNGVHVRYSQRDPVWYPLQ